MVGQPALRFVNRYRCKDGGYRWISWVGIQEDGFVYCTGRDITAEKLAETELAAAQEALRQSQKMETIGHLTGGIAHDFNNLLTGIIGSLDLVRRRMASGKRPEDIPALHGRGDDIRAARGGPHASAARIRPPPIAGQPDRTISIGWSRAWKIFCTARWASRSSCIPIWPPTSGPAFVDANQLENAILNLAINSRDAMPDGGRLTISTANTQLDETYTSRTRGP